MTDDDRDLYCRLSDAEKDQRRPDVQALFLDQLQEYGEVDDGFAFEFPCDGEAYERVVQFVDRERQCCPFLRFDLTVWPDDAGLRLEIGGSERIKSFLRDEMIPEVEAGFEA